MTDTLYERERAKYERAWAECPAYARHSPGLRHAGEAVDWFDLRRPMVQGAAPTVCDMGSGPGRALDVFEEAGYVAWGLDIAKHDDPRVTEHCLWDPISELGQADFTFCCDVLEHIPPARVHDVIRVIADATRYAAWMQVALFPDTSGTKLDPPEVLHMTVRPFLWWKHQIARSFKVVQAEEIEQRGKFWLLKA